MRDQQDWLINRDLSWLEFNRRVLEIPSPGISATGLREHFIVLIQTEAEQARMGRPARIIAKVNSLIDAAIIEQLYLASQAGVEIDLIVRGMCGLRPESKMCRRTSA